jgi:hypothetical protein
LIGDDRYRCQVAGAAIKAPVQALVLLAAPSAFLENLAEADEHHLRFVAD